MGRNCVMLACAAIAAFASAAPAIGNVGFQLVSVPDPDDKEVLIPVQLWRAEHDEQAPDEWNTAVVRQGLPRGAEEHVVPDAGHFVFLAQCSEALAAAAPVICTDAPGFDRTAFHSEFNQRVAHFFARELAGR